MRLPAFPPRRRRASSSTRPEKRTEQQTLTVERMRTIDGHVGECCRLFEEFARLFREREDSVSAAGHNRAQNSLEQWVEQAKESEIPEFKAFAVKLFQDMEAVVSAVVMPYSQGQTEGRMNKLKLIKRQMYRRGKPDLLRQRVMSASAA